MLDPILQLLVLKSPQLALLVEFYSLLGLSFEQEQHSGGPVHYSCSLGGSVFEIYPLPDNKLADTTTRLGFAVQDLDSVVDSIGKSHQIISPVKQSNWGKRAVVKDPDGRNVELYNLVEP